MFNGINGVYYSEYAPIHLTHLAPLTHLSQKTLTKETNPISGWPLCYITRCMLCVELVEVLQETLLVVLAQWDILAIVEEDATLGVACNALEVYDV